jgi:hypothetical protein
MKFARITLPLLLTVTCTVAVNARQTGRQRPSSGVGSVGPTRSLDKRARRAVTIKLRNGETLECDFIRADEESIEIDLSGERRELPLDEVAALDFAPAGAPGSPSPSAPAVRRSAPLVLTARHCETFDKFTSLTGEVWNASGRRINGLTAVGTFRNRSGAVVKVGQNLIGDVAAGETGSFKVMWWYDPRIDSCSVSFKIFGGKPVPHTEALQR